MAKEITDWEDIPVDSPAQASDWEEMAMPGGMDLALPSAVGAASDIANEGTLRTLADLGIGTGQSATLGFGDELLGASGAGIETLKGQVGSQQELLDQYRKYRDVARQKISEAEERSPTAFGTGSVVGSLIPGLGTVGAVAKGAKGLGLLGRIAQGTKAGATAGGLYGLGQSEADLTKGEILPATEDVLGSALTGAGVGAALPAAGALVSAPFRGAKAVTEAAPRQSEYLSDLLESFRRGKSGQQLAGKESRRAVEKALDLEAEAVNKELSSVRSTAGRSGKEALKRAESEGMKSDVQSSLQSAKARVERLPENTAEEIAEKNKLLDFIDRQLKRPSQMSPLELSELEKSASKLTTLGDQPLKSQEALQISGKLEKELKESLRQLPKYGQEKKRADELFSAISQTQETIGKPPGFTGSEKAASDISLAGLLRRAEGDTSGGASVRQRMEKAFEPLEKVQPERAANIKQRMLDKATAYDIASKIGKESLDRNILGGARSLGLAGANIAGLGAKKATNYLQNKSAFIRGATPDILKTAASKIQDSNLSNKLMNIASVPENRRQALLFALLQNPGYRQALQISDTEEE